MVRPSDVREALQRSPVPLGAGALAESLGSHWGTVAEILLALERQGDIVRQGHGWVAARPVSPTAALAPPAPLAPGPSAAHPAF